MRLLCLVPLLGLVCSDEGNREKRQDGLVRSYFNEFPAGFSTLSFGKKVQPKYEPVYPTYEPEYPTYGCPKLYGKPTECRLAGECAVWYDDMLKFEGTTCELEKGVSGLCCPGIPYNAKPDLFKPPTKKVHVQQPINVYDLNAAAEAGQLEIKLLGETELLLLKKGISVQKNTPAYGHLLFFQTSSSAIGSSRDALLAVESTEALGRRFFLTPEETGFGLGGFSLRDTVISSACPAVLPCGESPLFRTQDGSCNNLRSGNLGTPKTQLQRILPAEYADGVWLPRISKAGRQLPSARLISISIVPDVDSPHESQSLWSMQWGQFVDHDLTSTPTFRIETNGTGIICCGSDGKDLPSPVLIHPQCFPIEIPEDDPFFVTHEQRCMSFTRSMPAPRLDCAFGHGEQMNQLTHYMDGSNVYGSTKEESDALRLFKDGKLKVAPRNGHPQVVGRDLLPPVENDPEQNCTSPIAAKIVPCFHAGDARSNEQPDLAVTHTVYLRQHNRVATELKYLNPHWDDERIFQETRKIVVAELQHITYNEWLQPILGREAMERYGLLPLQSGFSNEYSDTVNPTILNEFATAAFRFGHTMVQGHVDMVNQRGKKESSILLRDHFFKSQIVYTPGNLDKFLVGLAIQPTQNVDNYFTEEVTNHLFQEPGMKFGMDLVALNIQRGRDHGLPGYNSYRAVCGLPRARHFDDFLDVIPKPIVERFKLLYRDVDDVDLFIAGVSERQVEGAILGPTFLCIVADQFSRLRKGDRYFYDVGGMKHSFTEAQLNEIRKITLARAVCDNSDVGETQPLVFRTVSELNKAVDCDSSAIPRMNLYPWKEDPQYEAPKPKQSVPSYVPENKEPLRKPAEPVYSYQPEYKAPPRPAEPVYNYEQEYWGPYKSDYQPKPEYSPYNPQYNFGPHRDTSYAQRQQPYRRY